VSLDQRFSVSAWQIVRRSKLPRAVLDGSLVRLNEVVSWDREAELRDDDPAEEAIAGGALILRQVPSDVVALNRVGQIYDAIGSIDHAPGGVPAGRRR
jgi:hypothetical protein